MAPSKRRRSASRVLDARWGLADRLRVDVGGEVETHDEGLSLEELRRRFAAPDGSPSPDGFTRFCSELFGIALTPQQQDGARDLATKSRVLIVGANGLGKDTLLGCWSLYEAYVLGALVLVTAPSDRQVKEIMMGREIGGRWLRATERLPGQLLDRGLRIPGYPEGGLLAFTTDDPSRFQGFHAPRVCIVATESQGIERPIFDAMRRCLPRLIALSANPTSVLSVVYSFAQSDAWCTRYWSALDHPNVVTGTEVVAGAVTRETVEEIRRTDGEGSRFWQETVLGVFVQEVQDGICDTEDVDAATVPERATTAVSQVVHLDPPHTQTGCCDARGRPVTIEPSAVSVGIDPAGKGADSTAVVPLVRVDVGGPPTVLVWALHRYKEPDPQTNAERLTRLVQALVREERLRVESVVVDESALGAILSILKRLIAARVRYSRVISSFEFDDLRLSSPEVRGFNSSWQALAPARFLNYRAQAAAEVGQALRERRLIFGPACDPALVHALRQEILRQQLHQGPDGKWGLEKKETIRASLGRSPDLFDALCMAYSPWLTKDHAERPPHKRFRVMFA